MAERFRPDPTDFQRCVSYLCLKLETIAHGSDVLHAERPDLEALLASIPPRACDRVLAMLNDVAGRAEHTDPAMIFAVRYATQLAQDIWRTSAKPSHAD
jgi:hypothetical protein